MSPQGLLLTASSYLDETVGEGCAPWGGSGSTPLESSPALWDPSSHQVAPASLSDMELGHGDLGCGEPGE